MDAHRGTDDAHCVPLDPSNWMANFCLEYGLPLDEFQPSSCSSQAPITAMSDDAVYDTMIQTCIPSAVSSIEKGFITQDFITNFSVCSSYELSKFSSHLPDPVPSEVISFEKPCAVEEGPSLVRFAALGTTTDPRLAPLPSPVSSKPRGLVREMSNSSLGDLSVPSISDMVIPLCDDLPFDDGGDGCFNKESGGDVPIIDPSSMFEHIIKHETQHSESKFSRTEPSAEPRLAVPELPFVPFKRESSNVSLGDLSQASVGDMVTPLLDQQLPDERVSEEHLVEDWGLPNILDHLSTALQVIVPKGSFDTTQQQLLSPKNDNASTASVDDCGSRKRKAEELAEGFMPQQLSDTGSDTTTPKGLCLEVTSVSGAAADDTTLVMTTAGTSGSCRSEPRVRLPRYKKEPENKEYFEVTDNDVIFGRGTGPNLHNQRFRDEVVAMYREIYRKRTNNDAQKRAIIKKMMDHVKAEGGRFLAKDKIGWFEVTPKAVSVKLQKMTNEYKTQSERAKTSTKRKTNKKNR